MNKPIITVNDLNLWYGQTQALKNINIEIPEPDERPDPRRKDHGRGQI